MNKKILKIVFASAFALVAGYSVYALQQKVELSDLAMANVEALPTGEVIIGYPCMSVPYSTCIYLYPEYFELPGITYDRY